MARDPGLDQLKLDARLAYRRGDPVFVACQSVHPGMRASRGQARRGIRKMIAVVEAEGWRLHNVESVGAAAEIEFRRA